LRLRIVLLVNRKKKDAPFANASRQARHGRTSSLAPHSWGVRSKRSLSFFHGTKPGPSTYATFRVVVCSRAAGSATQAGDVPGKNISQKIQCSVLCVGGVLRARRPAPDTGTARCRPFPGPPRFTPVHGPVLVLDEWHRMSPPLEGAG
jgi:hypothetical protein